MADKIGEGFKSSIKSVVRQAGFYPYLMSLASMVLLSILYFCFASVTSVSADFLFALIGLVALVGISFLILPFLYGLTLSVAEGCRFKGKRTWSIKKLFNLYYHSNTGVYGLGSVVWKTLLAFVISLLISVLITTAVIAKVYPDMYADILRYSQTPNTTIWDCLGDYSRTFEAFMILIMCVTALTSSCVGGSELRKNEAVFYAASSLICNNRVNMQTRMLINFFRHEVFPTVRREHAKYNFMLFWPFYAVFFAVFIGLSIMGLFVPAIPYGLVCYIAIGGASLFFAPMYYYSRVFDDLFYIAYQDKIMSRLSRQAREFVAQGQREMDKAFESQNPSQDDDGCNQETGYKEEKDGEEDPDAKKPHENPDGSFDFTDDKDDSDHKDDGNSGDKHDE